MEIYIGWFLNYFEEYIKLIWLKIYNISLQQKDKNTIINKHMLNDKVINAAQTIMKKHFNDSPKINGFQSTIFKKNHKIFCCFT